MTEEIAAAGEKRPLQPLPWHEAMLARLQAEAAADQLPQTMLLAAPGGSGLMHFADVFTAWLLCETRTSQSQACGQCRGCRQWPSGAHPDALTRQGQGASNEITVDAVREVIEALSLSRHYDGHRVVRLYPAEAMNRSAANALLKTLEEPSLGTIFLLLSEQPRSLPATVRSRAQIRQLPVPSEHQSRQWLSEQGCPNIEAALSGFPGQPLRALAAMGEEDTPAYGDILQESLKNNSYLSDIAKKVAESREAGLAFVQWMATRQWQTACAALSEDDSAATAANAVAAYRLALDARAAIRSYTPPQLAIEALLVSWRALHVQSGPGKRSKGSSS